MKVFHLALLVTAANAFSVSPSSRTCRTSTTSLNLFGGGGKKEGAGGEKGPGLMDQMAMLKKAQEMASKKQQLDQELQKEVFEGVGADGKVTANFKFVPVKNPMDPQPDYEATKFVFDDAWYESASPEDIAAGCKEAIIDGFQKTNIKVAEKYAVLQEFLTEALGQKPQ